MQHNLVKIHKCTVEHFRANYFLKSAPCIIQGALERWPIFKHLQNKSVNLKTSSLVKTFGNTLVPVELGQYTSPKFEKREVKLRDYIEKYLLTQNEWSKQDVMYLAQHGLFDQIPQLRDEIMIPDYCYAGNGELYNTNFWLGPAGTVSPLHRDHNHNILCQVLGKKYLRLYSKDVPTTSIFPYQDFSLRMTSQVDVENVQPSFSAFNNLDYFEGELDSGEVLFIPQGFWHFIKSNEVSLSVNFWFR